MRTGFSLGPRLRAAADMIEAAGTVMDVGCDHGKLCAALLLEGRANRAIAMDISAPSLDKARRLARLYGLEGSMESRLSDGLKGAVPGEADTIVLAGMGGELMAGILAASPEASLSAKRLIMQPMSGIEELRQYLPNSGFCIYGEALALESGRIYQVIAARPGQAPVRPDWFPEKEWLVGPALFENRDPLLPRYLEERRARLARRLEEALRRGSRPPALEQAIHRLDRLTEIMRERFDTV